MLLAQTNLAANFSMTFRSVRVSIEAIDTDCSLQTVSKVLEECATVQKDDQGANSNARDTGIHADDHSPTSSGSLPFLSINACHSSLFALKPLASSSSC